MDEPVENAGLLGEAKSNRFSDPDFEKSYWRSAEAYKAEFEKRQREAMKSADMRAYPQQQDPRPDGIGQKPSDETQVAAGPAAALAAPYVIEGAAAASTAAAAYWAAHPELHPKEPNWFSKMLGKNETSIADPEAAKPKIEAFPADAGKPPTLEGYPGQPPHLSGKETFPAQEAKKGDNVIHEQRPSKVDLPIATEIRSIAPVELGKGKSHPDMDRAIGNIADKTVQEQTQKSIYGNGTLNGIDGEASNVVAPPVPKGQEYAAAKKDWEAFIRDVGGDSKTAKVDENGAIIWKSDDKSVTANLHPSKSRDGQPTFEVQTEKGRDKFQHKRRYYSE
ncbi:MAG: hypothetical protein HQL44_17570, partial [Alphaproteobacteria bacterium]|nr:hypothetical protein [Alphaproteobacteria bacterium]